MAGLPETMPPETSLVSTLTKEQRRHPRVQLNLPVRLRWLTPLGQLTEVTETLDVCRAGLRIYRREPCRIGAMVWVTFLFDSSLPLALPETPARVVRLATTPTGGNLVALEFESLPRHRDLLAALARIYPGSVRNRRRRERIRLALPIRVRPPSSPWPEETMTVDLSDEGLMFCTTRLYIVGDTVFITLPRGSFGGRWASPTELPARVVRIEKDARLDGSVWQQVAVAVLPPEKS